MLSYFRDAKLQSYETENNVCLASLFQIWAPYHALNWYSKALFRNIFFLQTTWLHLHHFAPWNKAKMHKAKFPNFPSFVWPNGHGRHRQDRWAFSCCWSVQQCVHAKPLHAPLPLLACGGLILRCFVNSALFSLKPRLNKPHQQLGRFSRTCKSHALHHPGQNGHVHSASGDEMSDPRCSHALAEKNFPQFLSAGSA